MVAKIVFIVFAQVVLMQSITAQYIGAYNGCAAQRGYARPAATLAASNGPGLLISSSSPTAPVGLSVFSENAIDGALSVAGALPFLGTVALEGVLPTAGAGNVAYNCGTGAVGITAEDIAAAPLGYSAGPLGCGAGLGYGCGAGLGCGCGAGLGCGYGAGLGYGCGAGLGCGYGAGPLGCAGSLGSGPYGYGAGLGYGLCGAGAYGSGLYGGCRALL